MSAPLEDYALIGDCQGSGLVGRDGSIDWLCVPRFDSEACFAALLGSREHGRWQLCPRSPVQQTRRRYRERTLTLETEMTTAEGVVRIVDAMPIETSYVDVVRIVEGVRGTVPMTMDLVIRFGYGQITPWVTYDGAELHAIAGPDLLNLRTPVKLYGEDRSTKAAFEVRAGERIPFVLTYHPSHLPNVDPIDPFQAVEDADRWWQRWAAKTPYDGTDGEAVSRSLITLKALTYMPTGGLVAAPTTSLPEELGGVRNWDYRFCWLRDATVTLSTLLNAGYDDEAKAFREWLLRAVAGDPSEVQIMYDVEGRRRLTELELDWLPGYQASRPVRIGNQAHQQLQLDIYGELINTMYLARNRGIENEVSWELERALLGHLEEGWRRPDSGIWEVRSEPRHFVHSKVMCWLAFDRAIRSIKQFGLPGPLQRWVGIRDEIHREVCSKGYSERSGTFKRSYDSETLDAGLLMMAPVGFLPVDDPRIQRTVQAIQERLRDGPLVLRYDTALHDDGVGGGEGSFLACSFWLVDNLSLMGRHEEARALFDMLLSLRNDVGLLAEEYDLRQRRQLGNFPQALSHLALINSAYRLRDGLEAPGAHRVVDADLDEPQR